MSPKNVGKSSPQSSRFDLPQWLQMILICAASVIGGLTVTRYLSGWKGISLLHYEKSIISGENIESYSSVLTEPWSKVSYHIRFLQDPIDILEKMMSKHHHVWK